MPPPRSIGRPKVNEDWSTKDMVTYLQSALFKQASEPNLLGYVPHPKQLVFHQSNSAGRWFLGGNRSGKSVAGVVEDLWWATKRHPHRTFPDTHMQIRGRVVAPDFLSGCEQILFPIFKRWVLPSDLRNGSWEDSYNKAERTLYFADDSFIEFKSSDQELDKHAGTSRHFIHFDEEPPQIIFDENMARLIDTGLSAWWITMTPVMGMTWMYDTLFEPEEKIPDDILKIIQVEMDENPHIQQAEKDKFMFFMSADSREKREKGNFVSRGGRVFKEYFETTHFTKDKHWKPPKDWLIYTSTDHGFRNPAAHLYHAVSPDGLTIVTFKEFYGVEKLVKEWATLMLDYEKRQGLEIYMRTGDPAMKQRQAVTGSSILQEYWENGIEIGVESVPKDPSIGIDKMTSYFKINPKTKEPFWTITQNCPSFNKELKRLSWETYASAKMDDKNNPIERVHKKNDHAFDSAKYFATFMPDLRSMYETVFKENDVDSDYVKTLIQMSKFVSQPSQETVWETNTGYAMDAKVAGSYNDPYGDDDY